MGGARSLAERGARNVLGTIESFSPPRIPLDNHITFEDAVSVHEDWDRPADSDLQEARDLFEKLFIADPVGETEVLLVAFSSLGATLEHSRIMKNHLSGKKIMTENELKLFKQKFSGGGWDDGVHGIK